ncbi:DUF3795 domain-containing protein [Desulfosporosinus sp. HMP52]|uniref:DUF3795 domain-containing protein n=1 Tax=Desulfosporosinus sp. HMP52 TaxID=1487923 RepID=UPI0009DF870C|nr:DUF3795 domain-containing protein [Desulfosporosinus sp. HMP52]
MSNNQLEVNLRLVNQKVQFIGVSESNPDYPLTLDYLPPLGDGQGFRGLELFLMSFTGCVSTAMVGLLRKMGKKISGFHVKASGIPGENPLSLQGIHLKVILESLDAVDSDLQNVIKLAEEISPVWLVLNKNVEVKTEYEIVRMDPIKMTSAVCGLFCPSCTVFIATKEEPERLKKIAVTLNQTIEETHCEGCRSIPKTAYCSNCRMIECARQKGIEFCGECEEFPCKEIKTFQALKPHRLDLWQSHQRIKDVGYEQWAREMSEHYSCPKCHTLNSAYDLVCRKCGNDPSCAYVGMNKEAIVSHISKVE